MTRRITRPLTGEQAETVVEIMTAHGELTLLVRDMAQAWETPGRMHELVNAANQRLTVLLHNAEYLARTYPGRDCPDCETRGWVQTCTGGIRTCDSCQGRGCLPV